MLPRRPAGAYRCGTLRLGPRCPRPAQVVSAVLRTARTASTMKPASQARMIAIEAIGTVPVPITSVPIRVIW